MARNNAAISDAVLDQRFGSLRHLQGWPDNLGDIRHDAEKEAAELLIDALDCLQDTISSQEKGEDIDEEALSTIRHRLEELVRLQRLLRINKAAY